jgi:hypothetical protein
VKDAEKARSERSDRFQHDLKKAMQASLREARQENEVSASDMHSVMLAEQALMREAVLARRKEKTFGSEGADKTEKYKDPNAWRTAKAKHKASRENKKA